jgi:predicted ribosome quality control (RQC) complex YloA/Tae2 family protein
MEILRYKHFEAKDNGIKRHLIDDFVVFQGKNAAANDFLTLELSSEDDIWMHAKGVPGSHVLIKVSDKLPTLEVIKKAAQIAADNSKGNSGSEVTVVYCKRKFVHKRPGMNPGQVEVEYKNSNQIIVTKK